MIRSVATVLLLSSVASAQPGPAEPAPARRHSKPVRPPQASSDHLSVQRFALGGITQPHTSSAGMARLGVGIEGAGLAPTAEVELWSSGDGAGISLPITLRLGVGDRIYAGLGVGVDLFHYDQIDRQRGVGLLAPMAVGELGVRISHGLRLSLNAYPEYRWHHFGTLPDRARMSYGLCWSLLEAE